MSELMQVKIPERLLVSLAPEGAKAPWLSGNATWWVVQEEFHVYLDGKIHIVPEGYIFNGSSIPQMLWWYKPPTYAPAFEAACFHDICYSHWYQGHIHDGIWRPGVTKKFADDAFASIMDYHNAPAHTRKIFHKAVRTFGGGGW